MKPAIVETRTRGTAVDITVSGEIDLDNAARFEAELGAAIGNDARVVRVDLGDADYIDSAGIRALVLFASRLHIAQIDLELVAPPASLAYRVMEISGLSSLLHPRARMSTSVD